MILKDELKSAGVYPIGPVSAWPKERNEELNNMFTSNVNLKYSKTSPGIGKMAKGLVRTGMQAIKNGKVSVKIREERYSVCKACDSFNPESKRCNDCGCFMEAKTWVGGDPDMLCPQKKWKK
tara:strand:+ start:1456 stop:1821 length:366 start_codon:yes stop_codon:yes gene_type:complete